LYEQYGGRWSRIAQFLPGRTEHMVKARWISARPHRLLQKQKGSKILQSGDQVINMRRHRSVAARRGVADTITSAKNDAYSFHPAQVGPHMKHLLQHQHQRLPVYHGQQSPLLRWAYQPHARKEHTQQTDDPGGMCDDAKPLQIPKHADSEWYYKDDSGQEQGPFSTRQMCMWHNSKMLPRDLMIKKSPTGAYTRLDQSTIGRFAYCRTQPKSSRPCFASKTIAKIKSKDNDVLDSRPINQTGTSLQPVITETRSSRFSFRPEGIKTSSSMNTTEQLENAPTPVPVPSGHTLVSSPNFSTDITPRNDTSITTRKMQSNNDARAPITDIGFDIMDALWD